MSFTDLYGSLVAAHAGFGLLGLAAAFVPLVARKGQGLHRRAGWVFVVAMSGAALSGAIIAGLWMAAPLAMVSFDAPISAERASELAAARRLFAALLLYLALLVFSAPWHGVRALRARRRGAVPLGGRALDRALPAALLIGGVALVVLGVSSGAIVHIAFGAFGAFGGYQDLRFMTRPPARRALVVRHLEAMLGGVIAGVTAFLVFGAQRWLGEVVPSSLMFVPWLAPTALGSIVIVAYRRRFRTAAV